MYRAELTHLLFAFLLLFEQLLLSRDVAAVALCKNVLAQRLDRFAGDYLAADSCLYRYLEQLTRDVLLKPLGDLSRAGVRLLLVNDE